MDDLVDPLYPSPSIHISMCACMCLYECVVHVRMHVCVWGACVHPFMCICVCGSPGDEI